jgi:alpha-beta hydrolase superfamily lysophospholipase
MGARVGRESSSPSVAAAIESQQRNDPLYYSGRMRIATGLAIKAAVETMESRGGVVDRVATPFLCIIGGKDRVADAGGSRSLLNRAPTRDKQLVNIKGAEHDLFNEPGTSATSALGAVLSWLQERRVD